MYLCYDCEHANPVKLWKCPSCGAFGTFIKDPTKVKKSKSKSVRKDDWGVALQNKQVTSSTRYDLAHPELERVFMSKVK